MARTSLRGFTLIELLVVISIIGILAAILFPAAGKALDGARRAQARNDVTQFANALTAFEAEYGKFPGTNFTNMTKELVETLAGLNTNNNPRKITFLEVNARNVTGNRGGKSGTNSSGTWVDPWGYEYALVLDYEYTNGVKVSTNGTATGNYDIRRKVAVWNVNSNKQRQVRSWD